MYQFVDYVARIDCMVFYELLLNNFFFEFFFDFGKKHVKYIEVVEITLDRTFYVKFTNLYLQQPPRPLLGKDGLHKIGYVGCYLEILATFEANTLDPYKQGLLRRMNLQHL